MVAYNTVPLSEDARLNEPKAPQNRKAMIALVAAVCFASACAGAVAPSAVRGLSSLSADPAPAPPAPAVCPAGTICDVVCAKFYNIDNKNAEACTDVSSVVHCCKDSPSTDKITLTDPVATKTNWNLCKNENHKWECPHSSSVACKSGEYCKESDSMGCPVSSHVNTYNAVGIEAGCDVKELMAAEQKVTGLFAGDNNICEQKKKELGTCTSIEIKATCGDITVIEATESC